MKKNTICLSIIIFGIILRLGVYFQNRSLIIDEANLARNIVEKEKSDFFKPIDYDQYAPPLFLISVKTIVTSFGVNEYALKLISLLASVGTLILLYFILLHFKLSNATVWYLLLLFACSGLAIRYATEFKQYSSDAFLCLLFVWWGLRFKTKELSSRNVLIWGTIGAIGIWASMPLVFVLAGIGFSFFYKSEKGWQSILKLGIIGVFWLVSFSVYFLLILKNDTQDGEILNFHNRFFFILNPSDGAEFIQSLTLLQSLLRYSVEQTVIGNVVALSGLLFGIRFLFKKMKYEFLLLLSPILITIIASHFNYYSLIGRLVLFMIPILMIIIGIGHSILWNKCSKKIKCLFSIAMVLTIINQDGYKYFLSGLELEDSKSLFSILKKERNDEELIYVNVGEVPAFLFYNEMHDDAYNFKNYFLADINNDNVAKVLNQKNYEGNFWLFFSHTFPQSEIEKRVNQARLVGLEKKKYLENSACLYFFEGKKIK